MPLLLPHRALPTRLAITTNSTTSYADRALCDQAPGGDLRGRSPGGGFCLGSNIRYGGVCARRRRCRCAEKLFRHPACRRAVVRQRPGDALPPQLLRVCRVFRNVQREGGGGEGEGGRKKVGKGSLNSIYLGTHAVLRYWGSTLRRVCSRVATAEISGTCDSSESGDGVVRAVRVHLREKIRYRGGRIAVWLCISHVLRTCQEPGAPSCWATGPTV